MLLEGHYQNAYVTSDIDRAVEALRESWGALDARGIGAVPIEVRTPNGGGTAVSKLAFAWVGNLQYELIEPVSGPVDLYREAIAPDRLLTFHHVGLRVEDWDGLRGRLAREGRKIALEGETQALKFCYVDARDSLGHYLEYVWAAPQMWAAMGAPWAKA